MQSASEKESVAILLDFENAKDADLQRILGEAARWGRVTVRRAYADWTRFGSHAAALREAGFEEIHQSATAGRGSKNATDIHLVVDAMDLLYTRPVDTFVLVTADSDFAKLARRLREGGKRVVGLGARGRVGRALVQSCDEYVYYDAAPERKEKEREKEEEKREAPAPRAGDRRDLENVVRAGLDAAMDETGRAYGGRLHETIRRLRPDFNYRDYGFSSFRRTIESLAPRIRSKQAEDASDFVVWDAEHETPRAHAGHAADATSEDAAGEAEEAPGGALSAGVQRAIDEAWVVAAGGRRRLSGRRAADTVSREYGVSKLADTPLGSLEGVFRAAPWLASRWKREGAWVAPRG